MAIDPNSVNRAGPGNSRALSARYAVVLLCGLGLVLSTMTASAQPGSGTLPNNVRRSDVLMLPQFCWGYFIGEMRTPDYMIPGSCGPYTNHYCEALLPFTRAKVRGITGPARETAIRDARRATIGLLGNIKSYPACPIRSYAESILAETNAMLGQAGTSPR